MSVLFIYLLIDFFISIFVDAFTNRPLHLGGTEYGDLGGHTILYFGLGSVLFSAGALWLGAIGARGVVRFRNRAQALAAGTVYAASAPRRRHRRCRRPSPT